MTNHAPKAGPSLIPTSQTIEQLENMSMLPQGQLLRLARLNTPTVYNGWEQITRRDTTREGFNLEDVRDFMPQMGPMIGYAVTVVIEPSQDRHKSELPQAWAEYRQYVANIPGPKVVVVQDMDKPNFVGAFWGEVNSSIHRALGCVGTITDGAIRDLDEIANVGFKVLAKRLCVGHAHCWPIRWGCNVEGFGCEIHPGQLIHADKHGFLAITPDEAPMVLKAALKMDGNECDHVLPMVRDTAGKTVEEILQRFKHGGAAFRRAAQKNFQNKGEW